MAHVEGIESTRVEPLLDNLLINYAKRRFSEYHAKTELHACNAHNTDDYTKIVFINIDLIIENRYSPVPSSHDCDKCGTANGPMFLSMHYNHDTISGGPIESQRRLHELHATVFNDFASVISWCGPCLEKIMRKEFGADTLCTACNNDPKAPVFPVETDRLTPITRTKNASNK